MGKLTSTNPSTNKLLGEAEISSLEDVHEAVVNARKAFKTWSILPLAERIIKLRSFVPIIQRRAEEIAQLVSQEMGMIISESRADVNNSIEFFSHYLDTAEQHLAPKITYEDDTEVNIVYREPRGVVANIIPWNFPLANFVWGSGQNLIAGNTVVLKHSEEVPLFSKLLAEVIAASDIPAGVFRIIYGDGMVGDMLVHEDINMISFTGSTNTGHHLAKVAGEKFIPLLAELGGSAPGIIFEDVDIDEILETLVTVRFMNCGQMCDGMKRLLVHESKFDIAVAMLNKKLAGKKIGDATDEHTEIGPLVSQKQLDVLVAQVEDAVSKGATVICGGKAREDLGGAFFEPTILINVSKDMRVWQEEVFGPVLPVVGFSTEEQAIEIANDTKYGLGAYIFTNDGNKFDRVARAIQSGMVGQNNTSYLRACNPFGGYKQSGIGREHGELGFHDVTQVKVVSKQK